MRIDIPVGATFGRWTAISARKVDQRWQVFCRCACGKRRTVDWYSLLHSVSKSCGCLRKEQLSAESGEENRNFRHGGCRGGRVSPAYVSYKAMHDRTSNPKNVAYENYGGRGIKVSERWSGETGFANFIMDMGERPEGMTLDRKDPDGNYEPLNCKWSTPQEQTDNRRCSKEDIAFEEDPALTC
jgi:hypothetical protein